MPNPSSPRAVHDNIVEYAVKAHQNYMAAGRWKVAAMKLLDDGAGNGPEHDEFTRRIKELRKQGWDV